MPKKTTENEERNKKKNVAKNTAPVKKNVGKTSKKSTDTSKKTTNKPASKATNSAKKTNVSSKNNNRKKTANKKNTASKTTKKVENKNLQSKKIQTKKKSQTNKKTANKKSENKKVSSQKKVELKKIETKKPEAKKETAKKDEVKEKTVIEKIKAFIAKIVAMQEEARLEAENAKTEKVAKTAKKDSKKSNKIEPISTSYMLEYYDLPYRYNETVVKILAQTPKRLFVYWDISDSDRQKYLAAFGERFFDETYPVLLVHNEDMNYTFEVPINDFANSWYLDINDAKAKYTIQLGRKFRKKPEVVNIVASTVTENVLLHNDYVPIITSNVLEVPNDHILFENLQSRVLYRNVKTGTDSYVAIDNLEFSKRMGKIYSIYDVYKEIYKNEIDNETLTDLLNPSSMSSSRMSSNAFIQ